MSADGWIVEENITPGPDLDIRTVYIRLLEQMINSLKESLTVKMGEDAEPQKEYIYEIPTVIFAYLDTESSHLYEGEALAQLICYRDRQGFLKDLASYGDEEYIKQYGLESFIRKAVSKPTP